MPLAIPIRLVTFLIILWISNIALSTTSSSLVAKETGTTSLKVFIPFIPKEVSPIRVNTISDVFVTNQVYEKLFTYKSEGSIVPVLVGKLAWCPDQRCLTVTLKTKSFSDQTEVRAIDVKKSLETTIRERGAQVAWAFGFVKGFDDFTSGISSEISGIRIESDKSLVFEFKRPNPLFVQILAGPFFYIFKEASKQLPLGTGEYRVANLSPNVVELSRISIDATKPKILRISDQNLNDADIVFAKNSTHDGELTNFSEVRYDSFNTKLLVSNMLSRSNSIQMNRCKIVSTLTTAFRESFTNSDYMVYKGIPFTNAFKDLFLVAKGPTTKVPGSINVVLAESISDFRREDVDRFTSRLAKNGLKAKVELLPKDKALERVRSRNFQFAVLDYSPDYPHPDAILTPFLGSGQQFNWSGISDSAIDRLLMEARVETDKERQNQLYRQIIGRMNEVCPASYLGYTVGRYFIRKGLREPRMSSMGWYYWNVEALEPVSE
jgi:ABC-type transport system substrate-binding protein